MHNNGNDKSIHRVNNSCIHTISWLSSINTRRHKRTRRLFLSFENTHAHNTYCNTEQDTYNLRDQNDYYVCACTRDMQRTFKGHVHVHVVTDVYHDFTQQFHHTHDAFDRSTSGRHDDDASKAVKSMAMAGTACSDVTLYVVVVGLGSMRMWLLLAPAVVPVDVAHSDDDDDDDVSCAVSAALSSMTDDAAIVDWRDVTVPVSAASTVGERWWCT